MFHALRTFLKTSESSSCGLCAASQFLTERSTVDATSTPWWYDLQLFLIVGSLRIGEFGLQCRRVDAVCMETIIDELSLLGEIHERLV